MSITAAPATAFEAAAPAPRLLRSLERLRCLLLWFTGFGGAFVFMEPSPYEVASLLTIFVFALTGLSLRPAMMPLVLLLILNNIGFSIAVIPLLGQNKPMIWVAVSWYMAATAIFFAAALCTNTQARLKALVSGYTAAAVVASLVAILAYFGAIPRASLFLKFGRAQGTFNDPNVLGAFLALPSLLAMQRIMGGRFRDLVWSGALLAIFTVALLLSFSRGAWGAFAFGALLLMVLTFITSRSANERMRIVIIAALGVVALAGFIAAVLSVDQVAALFKERASFDQSYDTGHTGRFGRHLLGFALALETPLGIGPLQFANIFPEDPHNAYLNNFMSGGWLAGLSYLAIVLITVIAGLRFVFVDTPWRSTYLAVYVAYVTLAAESVIIDSDHWRHYFLLLGGVWGLMIASRPYLNGVAPDEDDAALARRSLPA
jgi:O-antigen ligase